MEEGNNKGDFHGNVVKQSSLRPISTLKPTLSGRSTPRSSPTFRRLPSTHTPRREGRSGAGFFQLFRSSRLVYWLLLITLWTYGGFYIQSKWAHGDNRENFDGFGSKPSKEVVYSDQNQRRGLISNDSLREVKNKSSNSLVRNGKQLADNIDVALAKKGSETLPRKVSSMKRSKSSGRGSRSKTLRKPKKTVESTKGDEVIQEEEIPATNASYGLLVGPFGSTEDRVLEWSPEKRSGTCDRKELFARLVWSRNFVLIIHELSMTGAPLSMLELATELLSCGATVHAVVLSRRGGLMSELVRRRIKVIDDKADHSYKAAMKADLVIAGSAVCAKWIEKYLGHYVAGSNQIAWWIMENRREYFDRSKLVLNQVKMLIFLSESQSIQWLAWCEEENIKLSTQTALIPLSVNDELAFIAGIPCSLNTPSLSPEKMLEKQQMLRNVVRQEMGLADNDMLVMSLGSINAAKGQLLLLESARSIIEKQPSEKELTPSSSRHSQNASTLAKRFRFRGLLQNLSHSSDSAIKLNASSILNASSNNAGHGLKILIGSVGSKSNKVAYVREILRFLSEHPELRKSVIWTPSTARVASLYSAADAYVTNSQGVGETFGRVTIEAMAFGLPVLGTDAGGTKEIVEHNATGLLHLIGRPGSKVLSQNLWFMLENPSARKEMGRKGREKVEKMYMKKHMYKSFFEVLFQCMRIK